MFNRDENYQLMVLIVIVDLMGILFAILFLERELKTYCYNKKYAQIQQNESTRQQNETESNEMTDI